jgi:hypothetical protein
MVVMFFLFNWRPLLQAYLSEGSFNPGFPKLKSWLLTRQNDSSLLRLIYVLHRKIKLEVVHCLIYVLYARRFGGWLSLVFK